MAGEGLDSALAMSAFVEDDLVVLLRHERDRPVQRLTEALLEARSGEHLPPVREAADRLLRRHAPWALDLTGAAVALVEAAGDERARRLFMAWSLRPDARTQGDLAAEERVSAQRVGQMVQSAGRRVRDALARTSGPLSWTARALGDRLGPVTTESALVEALTSLGANAQPAAELLRWLAGPYLAVPGRSGWLALEPRHLVSRTGACLAADGGVRRLADVEAELTDLGLCPDQLVAWLAVNGAAVVHELTVLVEGRLADAAERILDAHGTSRSAEEIGADLAAGGRTVDEQSIAAALRTRRFRHTSAGAVRLAAWGPGEDRPAATGRKPKKDRSRSGRPPGQLARPTRSRPPTEPERLWLWVKIDAEALRGADADVPLALAEGLLLQPPARRVFSSRWGPVSLTFDGSHPTRGSVRAVALAAGAHLDDTLLLGFSVDGDVAVEVRPAAAASPGEAGTMPTLFPEIATGGTR